MRNSCYRKPKRSWENDRTTGPLHGRISVDWHCWTVSARRRINTTPRLQVRIIPYSIIPNTLSDRAPAYEVNIQDFTSENIGPLTNTWVSRRAGNMKKITIKPQALANGIVLPAGTVFEVVEIAAHLSNPAFENPAEWDGRRYFDLRQKASSAGASTSKYDWGAATRDDLNFGYATHMCPGRSAGCSIVKMFIVKLLSRFELCLDDGETERYEDVHFGQFVRNSSMNASFSPCRIISRAPQTNISF